MNGARFSIGEALAAGLRLPIRHPLAVLVWALVLLAFGVVSGAIILPMLSGLSFPNSGSSAEIEAFVASMAPFQAAANLLNLVQLLLTLVIWTAAMRATLRIGRPDKWFFMRIGMDELRVGVMMAVVLVGLYILSFIVALFCLAIGAVLYAVGEMAMVIGVFIMVLVVMIGLLALWSRVGLLAPASMVLGEFAFVEGWRMGRGQTRRLMALNLSIWLIYILVYAVVGSIVAGILFGGFLASGAVWPGNPETIGDVLKVVKPMIGWIALAFVPLTLFGGWSVAFAAGALASAARQLADGAPVAAPIDEVGDQDASR